MIERLARAVHRRSNGIVAVGVVFVVVAGALGAGVASRLDPFGADDPATESVIAQHRLEAAGFRPTGVVVLSATSTCAPPTGARGSPGWRVACRPSATSPGSRAP
jgi:hypothetical protein